MRQLTKGDALALLEQHKRELLRHPDDCVMCALNERRDPTLILKQDAQGTVVLDRFGNRPAHLLVIARRHVEHATELAWPDYCALQRLAYEASQALERALQPQRVFIAALGASGAQQPMTFSHFHLHVVPVMPGDERPRPAQVFSWSEGVVTYDAEQAAELMTRLKSAWPAAGCAKHGREALSRLTPADAKSPACDRALPVTGKLQSPDAEMLAFLESLLGANS